MRKNVSGQIVGAQMVSASDGSAFTGSVTVYVTGNGGTQTAGSVGSGACTHEGNGFHSYAPAQAETNYDHVAFTFVGSGAVPATVQVFPTTLATDVTALKSVADDVKQMLGQKTTIATLSSQTNFTLTAGSADNDAYNGWAAYVIDQSTATQVALGVISDYVGSTKTLTLREDPGIFTMATGDTIILLPGKLTDGVNVTQIEGVDATDQLDAHAAAGLDAAGVRAALGMSSANLDTQLSTIAGYVDTEVAAIKAKTDNLPSDPADESLVIAATDAIMARLGAPVGASMSDDIAAVKSDSAAILMDTGTTLDGKLDTVGSNVDSIKAKTDQLAFTVTNQVDANAKSMNDAVIDGTGTSVDKWRGAE